MEPVDRNLWRRSLIEICEAEGPRAATNEQFRAYNALAYLAKHYVALTKEFAYESLQHIREDRAGTPATLQNMALRHGWQP